MGVKPFLSLTRQINVSLSSVHCRFLTLPHISTCIRRPRECLLNRRSGLGRNIEFGKLWSYLEDVDTCGVEDLFRGRYGNGEVGVFGQTRDEEHESTRLYLHFGKVGAAGGYVRVFPRP